MMSQTSDRHKKLVALQAAMSGNAEPLREFKTSRGRPYSESELEERRLYLAQLSGQEASRQEVITFFGRYEPFVGQAYELPNGMLLYFQ